MASIISTKTSGGGGIAVTGDTSGVMQLASNNGTTAVTIDASQNVGIGTASPATKLQLTIAPSSGSDNGMRVTDGTRIIQSNITGSAYSYIGIGASETMLYSTGNPLNIVSDGQPIKFIAGTAERMRIDSSGNVCIGKDNTNYGNVGAYILSSGIGIFTASGDRPLGVNRKTNDGTLVSFWQDQAEEGSISVSGTTVSYNGGHLSRWSQWQNETGQPEVYRGTVLDSTNDMCEWYDDEGNLRNNEQSTKTIVSATLVSKAVAGVFDRYDTDDKDNPYDFYVAQSGDFVIRVAAGTVVQNGDLLESAGDGTARVQADDICRSSTIAKVTSNYVSETYADGSFCVPCILMIG